MLIPSGVSRISFRGGGGGSKYFCKSGGYLHGALRHAARGFKNGAIWCVLENILLKFCKNIHFLYKNNR